MQAQEPDISWRCTRWIWLSARPPPTQPLRGRDSTISAISDDQRVFKECRPMARFKKVKLPDQTWETVASTIRNAMTASESVEVVSMLDDKKAVKVDVRAWNGVRKDKSNAEDASEQKDY